MTETTRAPTAIERKVDVGSLITTTVRVLHQAPLLFVALALLPLVLSLPSVLMSEEIAKPNSPLALPNGILTIAEAMAQVVMQAATIFAAGRLLSGQPVGIGAAIGGGARRSGAYFVTGLLSALVIGLGFVALIVPGCIAIGALMIAGPACVIERCGPIKSLKRSAELTKGNRWRIFAAILIIVFVPGVLLMIAIGLLTFLLDLLHLAVIGAVLILASGPIVYELSIVMTTVIFFEMRAIKEGIGPRETIAQVFD